MWFGQRQLNINNKYCRNTLEYLALRKGSQNCIIIIIIIINCNWVVTRWQWLFYMFTKYEIVY